MKLVSVRIEAFRNILDSSDFAIQPDVTCLVGKNESGKTSILNALWRLNPHVPMSFDSQRHYPKWLEKQDRRSGRVDEVSPIAASFALDDKEMAHLKQQFGDGVVPSGTVTFYRGYDNEMTVAIDVKEAAAVAKLTAKVSNPTIKDAVKRAASLDDLRRIVNEPLDVPNAAPPDSDVEDPTASPDASLESAIGELRSSIEGMVGAESLEDAVIGQVSEWLPTFFYFDEYSLLPGQVDINPLRGALQTGDVASLPAQLQTAVSLMKMAGASEAELSSEDYEVRANEMEAVANDLTRELLKYWSQNQNLRLEIDIDKTTVNQPSGQTAVASTLKLRVEDTRHYFTNSLDDRSMGFRWFVSFLAAFSEYSDQQQPVIILLDEPGLSLHGRAQADLLTFIDDRLARDHQVVYSTHSPFMVAPGRLEQARIVEDHGPDKGADVTSEVTTTDPDTLFPLQGALGYDLVQNLFISEHNVVVEGISDFTYLTTISQYLKSLDRVGLDERWCWRSSKFPTFDHRKSPGRRSSRGGLGGV